MPEKLTEIWPERIYFARHGRTAYNICGLLQGRLDPPLDRAGYDDAAAVELALRGLHVSLVMSSPMLRARQTAHVVAGLLGALPVRIASGLEERSYGQFEGRPRAERRGARDQSSVEPWGQFRSRVQESLLRELLQLDERRDMLLVAHSGVLKALLDVLCCTPGRRMTFRSGAVYAMMSDKAGSRVLSEESERVG